MEAFGIMGFIFGLVAITQILSLRKEVEGLKKRLEDLDSLKSAK